MQKKKNAFWKQLLFSQTLAENNKSHKIAYIAVTTALLVVVNLFFEFKFAETQFSFTLLASAIAGILVGPVFGFIACFLGDLVGFLYHNAGFAYLPWIGVSMGLTAVLAGFIVNGIPSKTSKGLFIKLALVALFSFLLCTVAINTTAFWLLYAKVDYWTYLISRLFVQGQIWNSLVNYALLFVTVPILQKLKLT